VSRLTPAQAMYHFISGYTARVAGTEMGVKEPQPAFSACFSAAFLVRHPTVYAEMLADKLNRHGAQTWLVNTGWSGGSYGIGSRMKLAYTRAIIDAIHSGTLTDSPTVTDPVFGLAIPTRCPGVPDNMLQPEKTWSDDAAYRQAAKKLAGLFQQNFTKYADQASDEIKSAAPKV
jgi:phosphoenolpyruvate carboxykinase (ATP)